MKKQYLFLLEILIIGIVCFLISNFLFQICFVQGDSMLSTYTNGQILIARKYGLDIKNGDIITIEKNRNIIIKRVIGVPNDRVIIKEGYVYVNDNKFDDIYIEDAGNAKEEILLKENEYFVLGDNRNYSIDSRFDEIGIIKKEEIKGIIL